MSCDQTPTVTIPVELANGTTIQIEISRTGREDIAFDALPFKQVTDALQEIIVNLKQTLERVNPDKASVRFGVEMAVEAGNLTAMIVKGACNGNLEITLEWDK